MHPSFHLGKYWNILENLGNLPLFLQAHRGNKLVVSAALEFGAEINQMSVSETLSLYSKRPFLLNCNQMIQMDGFTALDLSLLPASKHAANVGMPEFLINLGACL